MKWPPACDAPRIRGFFLFAIYLSVMLKMRLRKVRLLYILLAGVFVVFACALSAVFYFSDRSIAEQTAQSNRALEKVDVQIKKMKADKKAREEAERIAAEKKVREEKEAAEKKAASDAALTAQLQGQVIAPAGCAATGAHSDPSAIDVVINKKRCFNPITFTPSDLTSYSGFVVSAKIIPDMTSLFDAAAGAGVPLSLTSSYRSYSNQVSTYNYWVQTNGSQAAADTVSARPGYSEHQTGLVFDLSAGSCSLECFRGTKQYEWMVANAHTYGFIERYPVGLESITGYSAEAWHWRYVGKATASQMKISGVKTLEQLWNIPGGSY